MHLLKSKLVLAAQAAILLILAFVTWRTMQANAPINREVAELKGNIQELQRENASLKARLEYLSNQYNVEKELKSKQNLTNGGEHVIILPLPSPAASATSSPSAVTRFLQWLGLVPKNQ